MSKNAIDKVLYKENNRWTLPIILLLAFALINGCMQMMAFNSGNIKTGLVDNDQLKILQVFGYNEERESSFLDKEKLESMDHVTFVIENLNIVLDIYDEKGETSLDSLFLVNIPKDYSQYFDIGEMENGVIYVQSDKLSDELINNPHFDERYDNLNLKIEEIDISPPSMIEDNSFVTDETYNDILQIEKDIIGKNDFEVVYSIPEYLIGVDKTENVFSVVDNIKEKFADYDAQVFYQLNGMKDFVDNSNKMLFTQGIVAIAVLMITFFMLYAYIRGFVSKREKEMMILYINGMPREDVSKGVYANLRRPVVVITCVAFVISFCFYILLQCIVFKNAFSLQWLVSICLANIIIGLCLAFFLKNIIASTIAKRTSNKRISQLVRD